LHGSVEPNSGRASISVSLNLRLPSGQLAAAESAPTAVAAARGAFADLLAQLKKHKELLRSEHKWRRRGAGRRSASPAGVPFRNTHAAVPPAEISQAQIRAWVNANLERLESFVERELRYRQATGKVRPGQVTRDEVIDEVIARALDDRQRRPQPLTLERWLYRLSIRALGDIVARNRGPLLPVPLERSARKQNIRASDEPELQYHQPDELLLEEDIIPDRRVWTPEDIASSDEILHLVDSALVRAPGPDREAFVLFAVEGFTVEEIAATTDRSLGAVRKSIAAARDFLQKALPVSVALREKLLHHSRIA
ncbi:MAG: RNA polymerase sigma factor, partial [Terriglobales bacterium]